MGYAPESGRSRETFARSFKIGLMPDASGMGDDRAPPRDIKKLVLIIGLGTLSWVATYVGMLELIQANMGDLPLTHKVIIGFSVAMLMTMIIWLLDQIFSPIGAATRLSYIAGYLFLSLISVGFGFGFFWKVLESRAESGRSAELAVTAVQSSLNGASTRLEQLNSTLLQLAAVSRQKAEVERAKGTSCPNSKPGDGPRRRMRDEDAARFSFASDLVAGRVATVKADIAALDGDLAKITNADPSIVDPKTGTRNEFMKTLGRKLDMTVSSFNALRTDPQLKELRQGLLDRADRTAFGDPKAGGFVCPDTELAQALRGAARALAELPVLENPTIAAVEGSEATIEAFRRLTTTFYGLLSFDLPPSAEELRELQKKAMQSVEAGPAAAVALANEGGGLSKRDYVPLAVAIFVDICLLLVSIGRPGHRLQGLVPKMREAERGPVIEILSRFNDIHRDPEIRESFELFRHVVFDVHGTYYVAVPLDAPPYADAAQREELRTEAQLLANLFTSFEKDRIFRRTWTPFTAAVRRKLTQQGSKFANSEAFRIYKFRDGAWSEIILGAVMGAARRAEAEAHRRRIARDLLRPVEPTLDDPLARARTGSETRAEPAPAFAFDFTARPAASPRASERTARETALAAGTETRPSETWPQTGEHTRMPSPRRTPRSAPAAADIFGPYARSAEAELRAEPPHTDDVDAPVIAPPANSNIAPVAAPAMAPAEIPAVVTPAVIAMPAPKETPRTDEEAWAALAPRIDVVLKRETATVSLPLDPDAPTSAEGLIGRLGEALAHHDRQPADQKNIAAPIVDVEAAAPVAPLAASAETFNAEIERLEHVADDLSTDPSTEDAAVMAGRLRPALAKT